MLRLHVISRPSSVYLLLVVLFRTLSSAGARIAGNSGIGVYLGFLFGSVPIRRIIGACTLRS